MEEIFDENELEGLIESIRFKDPEVTDDYINGVRYGINILKQEIKDGLVVRQ